MEKNINICKKLGILPQTPNKNSIIGLAIESFGKGREINGLRHPPEKKSNGWYIWEGGYSENQNFFTPICLKHLKEYIDVDLEKYLELPPGFRFLIDRNGYEDIWLDQNLLDL